MSYVTSAQDSRSAEHQHGENTPLLSDHSTPSNLEDGTAKDAEGNQSSWWQVIQSSLFRAWTWVVSNVFSVITGAFLVVAVIIAVSIYYKGKQEPKPIHAALIF